MAELLTEGKMLFKVDKDQTGFTLIEVLITVGILSILTAVAVVSYHKYMNSAQCAPAEVAAQDTMLALVRSLYDTGNPPSAAGYANSHTLPNGETLTYDTGVEVSYSGAGTQANPFVVNAKRSNPVCEKGDGTYTLNQNQTRGSW